MRGCSRHQSTHSGACWEASQAGFEGPELTPDGGCTIQPSSAVAVVESIRVSVGRAESHHSVVSVTLRTLGSRPSGFVLTELPLILQTTCPANPASLLPAPCYSKSRGNPGTPLLLCTSLWSSPSPHPTPTNHISLTQELSCPSVPGGVGFVVVVMLGCLFECFLDKISLRSPGYPGTCSVDPAGLKTQSTCPYLPSAGLKGVCATTTWPGERS